MSGDCKGGVGRFWVLLATFLLLIPFSHATDPIHVHWMAPFFSGGGYCSEAVGFVLGLHRYLSEDVSVSLDQHGDAVSNRFLDELPSADRTDLLELYHRKVVPSSSVVVCHSEPGAWHPANYPTSRCPPQDAKFSVGRTMFESDRLPDGWDKRLQKMDEIWVPTEFHRDIFIRGGVDAEKVAVIGEPIDTTFFTPSSTPTASAQFNFLSVFKWEWRKGWDVLLKAFVQSFRRSQPVHLHILTTSYHSTSDFHGEIQRFFRDQLSCDSWAAVDAKTLQEHGGGDGVRSSSILHTLPKPSPFCIRFEAAEKKKKRKKSGVGDVGDVGEEEEEEEEEGEVVVLQDGTRRKVVPYAELPRIHLLPRVPQQDLPSVYHNADAFVLPSRGEGWGRPHVEAMASGLPVIATNWSGPTAFLDDSNGYPLRYTHLRPVPDGPFRGHLMAEPDEAALARLMQHLVSHKSEAAAKGRQARADMVARFHPSILAAQVKEQLEKLTKRTTTPRHIPPSRRNTPKHPHTPPPPTQATPPPQHTVAPVPITRSQARNAPLSAAGTEADLAAEKRRRDDEL